MKKKLTSNLQEVNQLATASKFKRLFQNPIKYLYAILYRELFYKRTKKEISTKSKVFFGTEMNLLLPSSTDIYLTGGKSHNSEIRLAQFLINQLNPGDTFVDIGAHYGYFSLLASKIIGDTGKVIGFEAAPTTFKILTKNNAYNTKYYNLALSNSNQPITFYEFPNLFSEYNTIDISQFINEPWFEANKPKKIIIKSTTLDDFFDENKITANIIKLDVEGAEFQVLKGGEKYLHQHTPTIVMEFLSSSRGNAAHIKAKNLLSTNGYKSYSINNSGNIEIIKDIEKHLQKNNLDSDNIVFLAGN